VDSNPRKPRPLKGECPARQGLEGVAFEAGSFYPVWPDNSNSTGDNPNGALFRLDLYTAKVTVTPR